MKDLRCPECGALIVKSSESNVNLIEGRCRRCKTTVRFQGGSVQAVGKPLDRLQAVG